MSRVVSQIVRSTTMDDGTEHWSRVAGDGAACRTLKPAKNDKYFGIAKVVAATDVRHHMQNFRSIKFVMNLKVGERIAVCSPEYPGILLTWELSSKRVSRRLDRRHV
ncbi:MAG: hypothetical protein KDI37_10600, partial [Xanthomonadales bacterium]|nr:hypothetical protein [Xanthomonadales bacterium]